MPAKPVSSEAAPHAGADHASLLNSAMAGAIAGVAATLAMSPVMTPAATLAAARSIPGLHPLQEFPPRQIVEVGEQRLTGRRLLSKQGETVVTWLAHIGYGAAMGALYGCWRHAARRRARHRAPPAAVGATFGLGVWAAGYLGWLPVLGVDAGTPRGDARDVPVPLAAHAVYGATLGVLHNHLQ